VTEEELTEREMDFESWLAEGRRLGYCSSPWRGIHGHYLVTLRDLRR
jgi:hypothetical protein